MSEEQLKAFLEKVKSDTELQVNLKAAADSNAVVSIAKKNGFNISTDDLKKAQSSEPTDNELERAAGGCGIGSSSCCFMESICQTSAGHV